MRLTPKNLEFSEEEGTITLAYTGKGSVIREMGNEAK
jgi:hypothetical protein